MGVSFSTLVTAGLLEVIPVVPTGGLPGGTAEPLGTAGLNVRELPLFGSGRVGLSVALLDGASSIGDEPAFAESTVGDTSNTVGKVIGAPTGLDVPDASGVVP